MTMQEEITGLCVNCNNKNHCSYLTSMKGPIWCCEEYDNYTPVQQNISVLPKSNPGVTQTNVKMYSNEFQGLCMNCENNSECKSAGLPGGVWHCEEYR